MSKPTVHYRTDKYVSIHLGRGAFIAPVDHPSPLVSNEGYVQTSKVVEYDPASGSFETENTRYVPVIN